MNVQNSGLWQSRTIETNHPLASHTSISSPCGKFKVRCKVNSISNAGYELALLYHRQGLGDRYQIGQHIKFYHESEHWELDVTITSQDGNSLKLDINDPITTVITLDSEVKKSYTCELLGQYCDLYRVSFSEFDQTENKHLMLRLPNGEQFPVQLRWREEDEICFQKVHRDHSLVGGHRF